MAYSSSLQITTPQEKYDVFLNFKGEDTGFTFTSHLYAALKRKHILTFTDNKLRRGEEISASLLKVIEESKLSIIIFSENYASSKWCLDELVKILNCRKNGQILVPIFYHINPCHVRNLTGHFGDGFARLIKEKTLEMDKIKSWRAALKEVTNLSGWNSRSARSESEFVEEIVKDALNKLNKMSPSHFKSLVGIDGRIKRIESLMKLESQDIRMVGIWGMGGIGKTTLARAVFDRICSQFEGSHFIENVREKLERDGVFDLQSKLLSKILDKDIQLMHPPSPGNDFIKNWLYQKKILIVLDDVHSFRNLQELLPWRHDSFGPGSKILLTGRDKQVLKNAVDEIYEVEELNNEEALQLLKLKAFEKNQTPRDRIDFLQHLVNYVEGNPLALIVLGSTLRGKSRTEWCSAMNKLGKISNPEIQNVLRISYYGLDVEQQNIFLDVVYFFRGWEQKHVVKILDSFYSSMLSDLSILIDKSLITIAQNKLQVHELLQEMAFSIVLEESNNPGKRSRLWNPEDIYRVLMKKKGTEAIEGLCLNMSVSRQMHLEADAFIGMDCLRLLKFYLFHSSEYKVHLPGSGLQYLSNELRYLHWDGFPSKYLPDNFCAENLVELSFCESKIQKLWTGVQNLRSLRSINLSHSRSLTECPNLSKAENLERLILAGCVSLIEVHSSIQYLDKLEYIHLGDCYNLQHLPTRIDSKFLGELHITHCSRITKCPEISAEIESLDLSGTAIEELPQSISKLKYLALSGCSNVINFPKISTDIEYLHLNGTVIKEVPSSIQFFKRLLVLDMTDCTQLLSLPSSICKLKSLETLILSGCSKLERFPEIMEPIESMRYLNLIETSIKELPSSIELLESLEFLILRGTPIKQLPTSIKGLKNLERLELQGTPIEELPELSPSLKSLRADACKSLKVLSGFNISNFNNLGFTNCFQLDLKVLTVDMHAKIQSGKIGQELRMALPGNEIPLWFCDQNLGVSVTLQLPSNCHQLKGIAFCLVFELPIPSNNYFDDLHDAYYGSIDFVCHAKSKNGDNNDIIFKTLCIHSGFKYPKIDESEDHMLLWYEDIEENPFRKYSGNEVTFVFYPETPYIFFVKKIKKTRGLEITKHCKIKKCGVYLRFDENRPRIYAEDLRDQDSDYYSLYSTSSNEDLEDNTDNKYDPNSYKTNRARSSSRMLGCLLALLFFWSTAYILFLWN